jgi:RNA polymerase sigma-70 factor (ECF subfamily)
MSGPHQTLDPAERDSLWVQCIHRVAAGEQDALGELYDRSSSLVYSMAMRIMGDSADAEEIVLDVFTHVWQNAAAYDRARGTALAWLIMLTRSRALDRVRSRASRREREASMDKVEVAVEADAPQDYEAAQVRRVLAMLPAEQRAVIELAFYSGLSQTELAERLGLPLGTVKTRVRLGMSKLRDLLKGWRS